jgi:ABC-type lipoprotein release transport system permease subunit
MGAFVMLGRSELRRRWRSVVVLTVLVGFVGAVVLALVAGARRTDTSLERFERSSRAGNVEVDVGDATNAQIERFRHSPGVAAAAQLYQFTLVSTGDNFLAIAAQVDDRFGRVVDRARVIHGRAANPERADEVTIGEQLAKQLHVRVGDRLDFRTYTPADIAAIRENNAQSPPPSGPRVSLRIVGIVRRPLDLGGRGAAGGVVVLTAAFYEQYRDRIGTFAGSLLRVRTRTASDLMRVTRTAKQLFGDSGVFSFENLAIEGQGAQNAIDVATVGLYLAAAVAALTGLVGIGISLSREVALLDGEQLTLSALGVRPRERTLAASTIGIPVALGGAVLAFLGAYLASSLFPIGVAAQAEPAPGLRMDAFALGLGAVGVLLAVLAIAAVAAARVARLSVHSRGPVRPGVAARAVAAVGAPPTAAAGTQFALDRGRYRRALPVRSSLVGSTFGIMVVVAVLVFSASLEQLVSTPSAYGWTWDTTAGDTTARARGDDCAPITTRLTSSPELAAVASICNSGVEIDGRPLEGWGFRQLSGTIRPKTVKGRPPATRSEVALGAETLSQAHLEVGDRVRITGPDRSRTYRIVGQAVLPSLSDPQPLADGAVFTARGLARLGTAAGGWNLVVRLAPGISRAEAISRLRPIAGVGRTPLTPTVPVEIDRVRRIDGLPIALAAFVGVVALLAFGFALVSTVRRRRRDLAVFKTLGFSRRQVRATIAWHASTVAAIGLVVGVGLGLVAGRVVWLAVADELGVSTDPTWPVLGILLLVPAAFLAVNVIAMFPAVRAANTRPAAVLRSE